MPTTYELFQIAEATREAWLEALDEAKEVFRAEVEAGEWARFDNPANSEAKVHWVRHDWVERYKYQQRLAQTGMPLEQTGVPAVPPWAVIECVTPDDPGYLRPMGG